MIILITHIITISAGLIIGFLIGRMMKLRSKPQDSLERLKEEAQYYMAGQDSAMKALGKGGSR